MNDHKKPLIEAGKMRQFLAAIVANLAALSYGTIVGWQSPSAPQLQSSSSPIGTEPMTNDQVSWLSGILCLSGAFVTLLLSLVPDKFSRKIFGCLLALPLGLSWLFIIFATENTYIFVARFLGGVGGAGMFFLVPIYVSEIASDSIRGLLGSMVMSILNFGILLSYILGGMLSFRAFAAVGLTVPILYLITFIFMPESPVYLIRQNRIGEAAKSLKWLKVGDRATIERLLSYMQAEAKESDRSAKSVKFTDLFRDRATIKGVIISMGLLGGQQLCGIFAMISYTETIFKISGSSLSPNTSAIIVAVIQFLGSYLSSSLVERAGRRILMLVSCMGMCACHCVLGVFCYLQELAYDVSGYGWIPVVSFSIFMLVYSLGMGTAPIVVASEIFKRDVSTLGMGIGLCSLWFTAFVVVKVFPDLVALLSIYGCFFLFAILCMCDFLFCLLLVPETKGRTREDIVNELNGIRHVHDDRKNEKTVEHVVGTDSLYAATV